MRGVPLLTGVIILSCPLALNQSGTSGWEIACGTKMAGMMLEGGRDVTGRARVRGW